MRVSISGLNFIKKFEGLCLTAYKCQAGVWTIGFGSTYYPNGEKVKEGDIITKERADILFREELIKFEDAISALNLNINQNQFDALVSFTYNVGAGAFMKSTLLKIIRKDPNDIRIKEEFLKWNKVRISGVLTPSKGLTRRRKSESIMYFT